MAAMRNPVTNIASMIGVTARCRRVTFRTSPGSVCFRFREFPRGNEQRDTGHPGLVRVRGPGPHRAALLTGDARGPQSALRRLARATRRLRHRARAHRARRETAARNAGKHSVWVSDVHPNTHALSRAERAKTPREIQCSRRSARRRRVSARRVFGKVARAGLADRRVPPSQGLEYFHSLRSRGVETRLLTYDADDHAIDTPKSDADHWVEVGAWFDRHL